MRRMRRRRNRSGRKRRKQRGEKDEDGRRSCGLTAYVISIGCVYFLYPSISERQLPHPVDASSNSCCQAEISVCCGRVKAIRHEVIVTEMSR